MSGAEVHVWRFDLLADASTQVHCRQLLSAEEQQRASRFHFERDQRRFVMRRAILRQILAAYCNCTTPAIRFVSGPYGKPEIESEQLPGGFRFSCSHSQELGLVAVRKDKALGVDVEVHRPLDTGLEAVTGYFAPAEREDLRRVSAEHRTKAFFDYWTCKEAFVKALGLGLSFPLDRFVVSISPGAKRRLVSLEGDLAAGERWQLLPLEVGADWSATLVVEGGAASVLSRVWKPDFTPPS